MYSNIIDAMELMRQIWLKSVVYFSIKNQKVLILLFIKANDTRTTFHRHPNDFYGSHLKQNGSWITTQWHKAAMCHVIFCDHNVSVVGMSVVFVATMPTITIRWRHSKDTAPLWPNTSIKLVDLKFMIEFLVIIKHIQLLWNPLIQQFFYRHVGDCWRQICYI